MITQLLRRLQGHAASLASAHEPARATDVAAADSPVEGETVPAAILASAFVRHLLGTAPGTLVVPGLAPDILDRLDAQCQRLDVARLPRLPPAVPQLLAAMRDGEADATRLAAVLSRDAALAGEIMRVAGCGAFHGAGCAGLPQAIETLGTDNLRYVVLTTAMRPILHADPSHQGASAANCLAAHAEARTWLCGPLAAPTDAGDTQLASVVAATALAAVLRMMPRPLLMQAAADGAFAPRLLELAAGLSARSAAQWRLCEPLQPMLHGLAGGAGASPAARALRRADRLAMLHVLRVAGIAGDDAHVTDACEERGRDARLLAALGSLQAPEMAA